MYAWQAVTHFMSPRCDPCRDPCSAAADYVGRMHKKTRAVALEEMALFVDHSYTAHSPELHTPSQNVAIQSYFNALLLPAATTLKAVAFLYYCKRGFTPVYSLPEWHAPLSKDCLL